MMKHSHSGTREQVEYWGPAQPGRHAFAQGLNPSALEGVFGLIFARLDQVSRDNEQLLARLDEMSQALADRPESHVTMLSTLGSPKWKLRRSILVNVEEYPDETIARWAEVEATGRGASEPEALDNLKAEIAELYDELSESDPSELGESLLQSLAVLSLFVAPRGTP